MKRQGPGFRRYASRFALGVLLLAACFSGKSGVQAQTTAPQWVCFPTCASNDARMLSLAGAGVSSLAGQEILISLTAAPDEIDMKVDFFDGDTGGHWDNATASPLLYQVFADPRGDFSGISGTPVETWVGTSMPNNAWSDLPAVMNTESARGEKFDKTTQQWVACSTCPFQYVLRITPQVAGGGSGSTSFKVRTDGTLSLSAQAFAFMAPLTGLADAKVIYPAYPALTTTTYDGTWKFAFYVPAGTKRVSVWDGDADWGSSNCTTYDSDDPDTPTTYPFAVTSASKPEGEASGGPACPSGSAKPFASGNPPDDYSAPVFRRSPVNGLGPNTYYTMKLPDGRRYNNLEPSGNQEWEVFTLDGDSTTAFDRTNMDYKVTDLPSGVYEIDLDGMDAGNLNAWRFEFRVLGRTEDDKPREEGAFYRIGRYVWYDTDEDGVPDADETPLANVSISVYDEDNNVQKTQTDATGHFYMNKPAGKFRVIVDQANFDGVLHGLRSTSQEIRATSQGHEIDVEVGPTPLPKYDEAIFGYVEGGNTPPEPRADNFTLLCGTSLNLNVLANDEDADGDTLSIVSISTPQNGTLQTVNGGVTYTPNAGFVGVENLTYVVTDGTDQAQGTITILVTNQPAIANNDAAETISGQPVTINVLSNDVDPDGAPLNLTSTTNGANGTVAIVNGQVVYTPAPGFWGTDTFTYTITDGCQQATATVTVTVIPPPVCYAGVDNPGVGAVQTWSANADGVTFTLRTALSGSFNDNTYGANQIAWPGKNHKFSHLVTSDMVQLALFDTAGVRKLEFKLDYFSAATSDPSGYASLGTWGGDGGMVFGDGTKVTAADSSLAANFRQGPNYWLTVDSPVTDINYTPNPAYPNWIFQAWYDVTVRRDAFGAAGFGYPRITAMHASPSKSGRETEPLKVVVCDGSIKITYPSGVAATAAGSGGKVKGKN